MALWLAAAVMRNAALVPQVIEASRAADIRYDRLVLLLAAHQ